jgi:hypothetical protein
LATLRRIAFDYYEGLAARTLDDIRSAEDALVSQQDQQSRRDALYTSSRADLEGKWRISENATLQTPSQGMIENPVNPPILTAATMPGDPADESVFVGDLEIKGEPQMEVF